MVSRSTLAITAVVAGAALVFVGTSGGDSNRLSVALAPLHQAVVEHQKQVSDLFCLGHDALDEGICERSALCDYKYVMQGRLAEAWTMVEPVVIELQQGLHHARTEVVAWTEDKFPGLLETVETAMDSMKQAMNATQISVVDRADKELASWSYAISNAKYWTKQLVLVIRHQLRDQVALLDEEMASWGYTFSNIKYWSKQLGDAIRHEVRDQFAGLEKELASWSYTWSNTKYWTKQLGYVIRHQLRDQVARLDKEMTSWAFTFSNTKYWPKQLGYDIRHEVRAQFAGLEKELASWSYTWSNTKYWTKQLGYVIRHQLRDQVARLDKEMTSWAFTFSNTKYWPKQLGYDIRHEVRAQFAGLEKELASWSYTWSNTKYWTKQLMFAARHELREQVATVQNELASWPDTFKFVSYWSKQVIVASGYDIAHCCHEQLTKMSKSFSSVISLSKQYISSFRCMILDRLSSFHKQLMDSLASLSESVKSSIGSFKNRETHHPDASKFMDSAHTAAEQVDSPFHHGVVTDAHQNFNVVVESVVVAGHAGESPLAERSDKFIEVEDSVPVAEWPSGPTVDAAAHTVPEISVVVPKVSIMQRVARFIVKSTQAETDELDVKRTAFHAAAALRQKEYDAANRRHKSNAATSMPAVQPVTAFTTDLAETQQAIRRSRIVLLAKILFVLLNMLIATVFYFWHKYGPKPSKGNTNIAHRPAVSPVGRFVGHGNGATPRRHVAFVPPYRSVQEHLDWELMESRKYDRRRNAELTRLKHAASKRR